VKKQYTDESLFACDNPQPQEAGRGGILRNLSARRRQPLGSAASLEVIAPGAVPDVELIADERKEHRVGAVQQLSVFDRLEVQFGEDVRDAPAVPAQTMPRFRREVGRIAHDWEYTIRALQ